MESKVAEFSQILGVEVPEPSSSANYLGVEEVCRQVAGELPKLVWDSAVVEELPFSVSEIGDILRRDVTTSWEHKKVVAMADSYRLLVQKVQSGEFALTAKTAADFNRVLSVQDNLAPGVFRGEDPHISGGGTVSVPGFGAYHAPSDADIRVLCQQLLDASARFDDPLRRAIYIFCTTALLQPFYEGNKRTGLLMAAGYLMSLGFAPLVTSGQNVGEYQMGLTALFSRLDAGPLTAFFCD